MRFRTFSVALLGICLFPWDLAYGQGSFPPSPVMPRVRAPGAALATLIQEAAARSRTFRGLVEAIENSDGIVYVEDGKCGRGVRACLKGVTVAGAHRILRVRVDTNKPDWDLMGSIGHELQHAVEVLGNPNVTSTTAMYWFYQREGRRVPCGFETDAAIRAGEQVRREVRRPVLLVRNW